MAGWTGMRQVAALGARWRSGRRVGGIWAGYGFWWKTRNLGKFSSRDRNGDLFWHVKMCDFAADHALASATSVWI